MSPRVTASALQLHPHVTVVIDEKAGKLPERREYYRYVEKMAKGVEHDTGI